MERAGHRQSQQGDERDDDEERAKAHGRIIGADVGAG
jgi:hypothetical protein